MVIQPVWRQGFEMDALAKQTFLASSLAYSEVSIISGLMYCRYSLPSGPSGVALSSAACLSNNAWSNHSTLSESPPSLGGVTDGSVVHPARAKSAAAPTMA